jgi:hypothetical protein
MGDDPHDCMGHHHRRLVAPQTDFQAAARGSCTRSLRLIPQSGKPGKMLSLQHVYEGVLPWYRIFSSPSSR